MRAVVMAALHFDFEQALTHGNTSDRARNALLFNEESTNMENFNNLLVQFRKLSAEQIQAMQKQGASGKDQVAIVDYKISQLKALNANVYNRVKNPYLQLFFRVMIEGKNQGFMANTLRQFIDKHVINLFDFVAICCKFLDD